MLPERLCEQKSGNFPAGLCFVFVFVPAVPIVRGGGQRSSPVVTLFNINLLNSLQHFSNASAQAARSCRRVSQ